jgi:ankyrin repeat/BTB/POZ domain-containing protein 1
VVLASRSSYFKQMFRTRWQGKRRVLLAHPKLDADAFKAVVHYLYNERLQVPRILLDETEAMVKQCKLWDLHGVLQREIKKQNVVRYLYLML